MKKAKFPVEAIALGIILFSKTMQEAMIVGILVIFSAIFAEEIKRILKHRVPEWSETISVLVLTGIVCASILQLAYAFLGWERSPKLWGIHLILGLLCARHVLWKGREDDDLLRQSAAVWALWILCGVIREFLSYGRIFGKEMVQWDIQSIQFQNVMFGFLASGMTLAFANSLFKTKQYKKNGYCLDAMYVVIPAICYIQPMKFSFFREWIGIGLAIFLVLFFFLSIQKKLIFSRPAPAWRGLPVELLSMGFLYMILNVY